MTERVSPHNIEAEQSVLGGILLGSDIPSISPDAFYRGSHRLIFQGIQNLESRGESVDSVILSEELNKMGKLEDAGGASYLASLVEKTPGIVNVGRYAEIVKEAHIKRRVISLTSEIHQEAFNGSATAQDLVDRLQGMVLNVNGSNGEYVSLKKTMVEITKDIEDAYQNKPNLLGLPTGLVKLDKITGGLQKSDLIVIAGRPAMGKTALAIQIARSVTSLDEKVALFSLEMSRAQLAMRLLSAECRISDQNLRRGDFPENQWSRITRGCGLVSSLDQLLVIDDSAALSELEVARRARRLRPGLVIVDYLQLMRSAQKADRKDLEIANITGTLKALAKELEMPVVILSQLNRKVEERTNKRPGLADLRDSGAIEQDADLIIFIYREDVYFPDSPRTGIADLGVAKNRRGPTGSVQATFIAEHTAFEDMAQQD